MNRIDHHPKTVPPGSNPFIRQPFPLHLLTYILVAVSITEALVMIGLIFFPTLSAPVTALVDMILLAVVVFPILYFLMLRPMNAYIETIKTGEEELRKAFLAEQSAREAAEILSKASLALTRSLDPEKIAISLLEYLHDLVPYDEAEVMLLESENRLVVSAVWTAGKPFSKNPRTTHNLDSSDFSLFRWAIQHKTSLLVTDHYHDPDWKVHLGGPNTSSYLIVPLIADQKVLGVCGLAKEEAAYFTNEHQVLVEALAGQASVTIQNAWLFDQVRASWAKMQTYTHRLSEVQENERLYIARELHDDAGQELTTLMVGLRMLEENLTAPHLAAQVRELKQITNRVSGNLHQLAVDLRPASLDHLGLMATLEQFTRTFGDRHGLDVQFKAIGLNGERLTPEMEISLYRIAQEALNNIAKHAHARSANVLLELRDGQVILIIEDDGTGFNPDDPAHELHLGLTGMRERTDMIHGKLRIESTPTVGTTIAVEVPYASTFNDCG